jgi:hypothetical protein
VAGTMTAVRRDRRPLAVAGAVAVVSVGLLALAITNGWLGADVGRGANFCEAGTGAVRQPANTFSNAGFVVVGLLVAWQASDRARLGLTMQRLPVLAAAYACLVVLLGPGSAAMHATQSAVGGRLDMASMYLVAAFTAGYAAMRWWRRDPWFFAGLFLWIVACCEVVGLYDGRIPVFLYSGNVAFAAFLVMAVSLELLIRRRGEARTDLRLGGAALVSILLAFAIWNASQHGLCDPQSLLQGHAAWHLLCAVAAYFTFRLYTSERAA